MSTVVAQKEEEEQSLLDWDLFILSIDPGQVNTGWCLLGLSGKKLHYVASDTWKFVRFGKPDNMSTAQTAADAQVFWRMLENGPLQNVHRDKLLVVLIENQFVNPSSQFRAGLGLRAIEISLATAASCAFNGIHRRSGIICTAMPRTVNAVFKIEGSKSTSPNFKWQALIDSVEMTNDVEVPVDFSKISKHEADCIWQALWYARAFAGADVRLKNSKTQETKPVVDATKKPRRKIAAKRTQATLDGCIAGDDSKGITGSASRSGDSGDQQAQQNGAGVVVLA